MKVFASHDWGTNGANHAKVAEVVAALRREGIEVWFDADDMKGNILDAMCDGINTSDVVLVFVTRKYIAKVESGSDSDNVRREFMYAARQPQKLLPVRFEEELPAKWSGPVGMLLGMQLYVDAVQVTPHTTDALVQAIRCKRQQTAPAAWNLVLDATHNAVKLAPTPLVLPHTGGVHPSRCPLYKRRAPSLPSRSPPSAPLKDRVDQALRVMGDAIRDREHTRDVTDRLLRSLMGSNTELLHAPIHLKVAAIEQQLGL